MEILTLEECEILIDALDAWEQKEGRDAMATSILSMTFAGMGCETKEQRQEALEKATKDAKKEQEEISKRQRTKREKSILLKAKLLVLRDARGIDSIVA